MQELCTLPEAFNHSIDVRSNVYGTAIIAKYLELSHITSSPHYHHNNEFGERLVKIFKSSKRHITHDDLVMSVYYLG